MGFILNRNNPPDYLITIGQGKRVITVKASGDAATDNANLHRAIEAAYAAEPKEAPKYEVKAVKRRLKVERKPDVDVETIHKEDPGKQGPIGGRDAQEPPPREDLGQDVNVGHGEDEDGEE